jgi:hypothetical protein
VAQLASVLAWGASGRPFESDHSDKKAAILLLFLSIITTMFFYTYVVYSHAADMYYAGITNNLKNRIKEHNKGKTN